MHIVTLDFREVQVFRIQHIHIFLTREISADIFL